MIFSCNKFKTLRHGLIFCFLSSVIIAFNSNLSSLAVTDTEIVGLKQGKVLSKSLTPYLKGNMKGAEAKVLINAPVEKVWALLENQEQLPEIVPRLKKVKVLEKSTKAQKVQIAIKVSQFLPMFKYVLALDQSDKYRKIKFNKVSGCFNKLSGVFELEPYSGGTILTYRMYVDTGFFIPSFVCTSGLRSDLPDILTSIKNKAESKS